MATTTNKKKYTSSDILKMATGDKSNWDMDADYNGDNSITSEDARLAARQAAGLTTNTTKTNTNTGSNSSYNGTYTQAKADALSAIQNRDKFKFDLNSSALYEQYKQKYLRQAELASQNAMGQTAALTGGYANSYAQAAAQQAYQNEIANLNDVVPDIYNIEKAAYDSETEDLYNKYSLYSDADTEEYNRYTDQRSWDYQLEQDEKEDTLNKVNILLETGQYEQAGELMGLDLSAYQTEQDKEKAATSAYNAAVQQWTLKNYEQDYNSSQLSYALERAAYGDYTALEALGISKAQYLAAQAASASNYTTDDDDDDDDEDVDETVLEEDKPYNGYSTTTAAEIQALYKKVLPYILGKSSNGTTNSSVTQAKANSNIESLVRADRLSSSQASAIATQLYKDGYIKG